MAHSLDLFECPICLHLLEEPVTTACGHSYCRKCINTFWCSNREEYSCPQCRTTFNTRPDLQRNTLLGNLLEEYKKQSQRTTGCEEDAAAPGDVLCDACTGRKRKARMFCLMCLASFCETHLQPHVEVPVLKKHKLIRACARIKESICSHHDRRLEIYCRSDEQLLCPLCVVEHKGHDIVEVMTEKQEKQQQVDRARQEIEDRVLVSLLEMKELTKAADAIRDAAWEACDDFERECSEHIISYVIFLERKCSEMRDKVGQEEKVGVDWTAGHLGQLEQEVNKLRRMEHRLHQLSLIDDPIQFLKDFQAMGERPAFTDSQQQFQAPAQVVSAHKDKLKKMCDKQKSELFVHFKDLSVSSFQKNPRLPIQSRKDLLLKRTTLDLDPNTAHECLSVTNTKKEISWAITGQSHSDHPGRFTRFYQVLCQNGLQENHYWEVEWDGGIVEVAVSYKEIQRMGSGKGSCFGHNKLSWKLICSPSGCTFWHNSLYKGQIPPARSHRVGVHLEYREGRLSFYSVSGPEEIKLLHQIQTTFTKPLYPGFTVDLGATLSICDI
ncbi:E3 ubiquitin/ISG15 ligase TRIM25 [Nothobranchius furzeri]|uniref:Tripartite motif-containing protein 47-like n=3 Tax=Nothobranchius furzeri TaxID=105023 RepID=A0A9D2YRK2_NOTFU|nr:tripartite motif-containing protein 47-like [Nothobranchius furzeri]